MKNTLLLFALFIMAVSHVSAQAVGTWQTHLAYSEISKIAYAGSTVYAVASGGLFSYNTSDGSIQTYDKAAVLSDCGVSDIAWCPQEGQLLIVYDNYNMDIMASDGSVRSLPDYMNKLLTVDKTVNSITIEGRYAYLSTGFGILKIDMREAVVSDTYNIGKNVCAVAFIASEIYAATPEGIYEASADGNPADKAQWKMLNSMAFTHIFNFKETLVAAYNGAMGTVDVSDGAWTQFYMPWFSDIAMGGDGRLICYGFDHTYVIKSATDRQDLPLEFKAAAYSSSDDTYWVGTTDDHLSNISINGDGEKTVNIAGLRPDGPDYNYFGVMKHANGKLYTANGFYEPERTACIQVYDRNAGWTVYDDYPNLTSGQKAFSINAIDIDPADETHLVAATQVGVCEYKDGVLATHWTMENSPLQPAATVNAASYRDYTLATALAYAPNGTLWIANSIAKSASLFALDGQDWTSHHHSELMNTEGYSFARMFDMVYDDSRSVLWIGSNDWRKLALTLYDPSTDQVTLFDSFVNQDGTSFTPEYVKCPARDDEGNIWVATAAGPFCLSASVIDSGGDYFTQVKVPRNDGTNYADYLLDGQSITSIAIDGADRKWFGTESNGVYLISADNMTQVEHFTAENSPLLDNNIESIAIDTDNGEVFFGTAKGLCSYMSGVTRYAEEMSKDNVYAYPNPVRPDYSGKITIVGLTSDADVKIVTVNGTLVNEGRSTGGTYSWDGCDTRGRRVASGVYMVQTATSDGKKGTVCKIAFISGGR